MWKQLFQATWKTHKTRFDDLISGIRRHGDLIVNQANLSSIKASLEERKVSDRRFKEIADAESGRKLRELQGWLRAPNVANDQHEFSRLRSEYPGTGRWLLDNQKFKDWFAPLCQSIPPVLWLNGIPGAGELVTRYAKLTDSSLMTCSRKNNIGFSGCRRSQDTATPSSCVVLLLQKWRQRA